MLSNATGTGRYVLCRRGVDSLTATSMLAEMLGAEAAGVVGGGAAGGRPAAAPTVYNIDGGLAAWHRTVDPTFPFY